MCFDVCSDLLKSERTISTQEVMRIACQICEPLVRAMWCRVDTGTSLARLFLRCQVSSIIYPCSPHMIYTQSWQEFLHSVGMVHRDLKPENILLDANLTIFLCDFGISKVGKRNSGLILLTLFSSLVLHIITPPIYTHRTTYNNHIHTAKICAVTVPPKTREH